MWPNAFHSTLAVVALAGSPFSQAAAPASAPADSRHDAALAAMERHDYSAAHEILSEILFDEVLASANELIATGNPQDGLLEIDRALDLKPDAIDALLSRGNGSLLLGNIGIDAGRSAIFISGAFDDASASFERVLTRKATNAQRIEAFFGASRSAYLQNEADKALSFARSGMQLLEQTDEPVALSPLPERTLAEAAYSAYTTHKGAGEDASDLFEEARTSVEHLLGQTPEDTWPWLRLSLIHRWESDFASARTAVERGLEFVDDPAPLLAELSLTARAELAPEEATVAAVEAYDSYLAKHPESALGHWFRAMEQFNDGVWKLSAGASDAALFDAASADFTAARTLDESLAEQAIGWEVLCRNGRGWVLYGEDDLPGALTAFRSTEEHLEGGLEYVLGGQLLSALQGLEFVAAKYNEREEFGKAAEIFDEMRAYQPAEVTWANNAGFFHRDAGVELEAASDALCLTARGEGLSPIQRASLERVRAQHPEFDGTPESARQLGEKLRIAAWDHMRKSYEAYTIASQLAPNDVRIVNDTALIQTYYLHEDDEGAEALLRRCIAMGAEQLEGDLDDDEREALLNAWGDSYQNLGVLYLRLKKNTEARELFERSVEIGPDPRQLITLLFLPLCDGDPAAQTRIGQADGLLPWGTTCPE